MSRDNFFTSYELAQQLMKRKMTMVGTVRKNKPELPPALLTTRGRTVFSSKYQNLGLAGSSTLWPVDLKLTHLDWNPDASLIHFQGQYLTICELEYTILQGKIQNVPKIKAAVDIGEFCLVEDLTSAHWYRGRVQSRIEDMFDVFLIDHGNILSVSVAHISSCSQDLFILPPKIVCGFLANVLLLQSCSQPVVEQYFSNLISTNVTGYIQALLPHKVLLLEAPDINSDLVRHGFGRYVDTDTFLFLVQMLTEMPVKETINHIPDLLIKNPRGPEFCFKSSGLQECEQVLSFCGPRLSSGTRAEVKVTAAANSGLFYCQMASMESDLWEMSKKLAVFCEHRTEEYKQNTSENVGLLCSVKGKDGKWYRGSVQFLPVNAQVKVLFVDYGYFESVKVENIHRLPPYFYSKPVMAFPCSLFSPADQDEVLKTKQLRLLKSALLGRVLEVEICGFDEEQHVYYVTIIGAEDNRTKEPETIESPHQVESVDEDDKLSLQGGCLCYETIMAGELSKTLKVEDIQEGSVFVGYVVHVKNPGHFWIRTQKRNDEFEEMMSEITEHFKQAELDEDVLLNPKPGTLCCAVYEGDMHFYRGIITDTLVHGAEVLFIDFGNIKKVPHMLIKKIPEKVASNSALAMCCSLANICPLDEVWTSTTSDFFRRAVDNKALLVHVIQMRKSKIVINLFEMRSHTSISELLMSTKQVDYIPVEPVVKNYTDVIEKTTCLGFSVMKNTTGEREQRNRHEAIQKMRKNEAEKTPVDFRFKALSLKLGHEFAVRCSYISSPSDFWCQPLDQASALEQLMENIQQFYSVHTVPFQSRDLCCIAKSPQDGRWYRALITAKQRGFATVTLVDYGCTMQVSVHSLRALMPEYIYLDRQAFRCSLEKQIEPTDTKNTGEWGPDVCNSFRDLVHNSSVGLKCKIVSQVNVKNKGLYNLVELYSPQTQQSITKAILEQRLTRQVTTSTAKLSTLPDSFVCSSHGLSEGDKETVYITHISSQWEVYCHLERNSEIIHKLEKKISEESKKMVQVSTRAVAKKLCLAKYFDGKWYRGEVHPVQSPEHLSVFFVDYGNTHVSEKTKVLFIPQDSEDLLYTPMQAMKCCLKSVPKEELFVDTKEWLISTILNKQVTAKILGRNDDGSFIVELFSGEVNINEKLKELIVGLSSKPKTSVCFAINKIKTESKNPHERNLKFVFKYRSQVRWSSAWPTTNRTGIKKRDDKNIDHGRSLNRNTRVKQSENKTENCATTQPQKNSQRKHPMKYTNTKSKQMQYIMQAKIPQVLSLTGKIKAGFKARCYVSHIESVCSFFLQLSEDEPALLKIGDDLNSSAIRTSLKSPTSLKISDIVLAEFEEDGAVYRSLVKNLTGSSQYQVEFVDYGNSAVVEKEKIYSIPKEHLSQPRFSIWCSLQDSSSYKTDSSFIDAVMNKPLMVEFVRKCGTNWKVKIEILEGEVVLNGTRESNGELNITSEKDKEFTPSLSQIEEKNGSDEQNSIREECRTEMRTPVMSTAEDKVMLKPQSVTYLTSLKVKSRTCGKKRTKKKATSESYSAMKSCPDVSLPTVTQARDTENGTILSVQPDGSFFVRLNRTNDLLATLEQHIVQCLLKCRLVARKDVKPGLKCLVQILGENKWQRAVVEHESVKKIKAFLVDQGITNNIPCSSIRRQCSSMDKVPNLALLCKMSSAGFCEEDDHKLCCETLKQMIGEEVKLFFVHYSETDNLWIVELVIKELFLIPKNKLGLQPDEKNIPSCAESQSEGTESGTILDACSPQQLHFAQIDLDKEYSGTAAAVMTPSEFWIVLDCFLIMNKVSIVLDDLPGQMSPIPDAHLKPGTCCLLNSHLKNKWCRAEIVNTDSPMVLYLVDYGEYEYIPYRDHSKLRKLPLELINIPKMIYPCSLRGIKPVGAGEQWTDEAVVFFKDFLNQKDLQIFFREIVSHKQWRVDVLTGGVHVSKELVDAGHASYTDVMLRLR
ncbi:tudor domain-containing protein 15-like [Pholidichthys leucotaenia]